jgi:hypothetical protein
MLETVLYFYAWHGMPVFWNGYWVIWYGLTAC